jgi:hypothetical protein
MLSGLYVMINQLIKSKGNPFRQLFDIHVRGQKNINPTKSDHDKDL